MPTFDDAVAPEGFAPQAWQSTAYAHERRGEAVAWSRDLERVLALPRREPMRAGTPEAAAAVELEMAKYSLHGSPASVPPLAARTCRCREIDPARFRDSEGREVDGCIHTLSWEQAWMLREAAMCQGLLASAPAGLGKTLVWLLVLLAMRDARSGVLVIPAQLVDQIERDYQLVAEHFRVPGVVIHQTEKRAWRRSPRVRPPGHPGAGQPEPMLHVIGVTRLSDNARDWLRDLQPDVVIVDEADLLKDPSSTRTIRLGAYFQEQGPRVKFACGTGSLFDCSLTEVWHLSLLALRQHSPFPLSREVTDEWDRAIGASIRWPTPVGELVQFAAPGESARQGFARRMRETLGVVVIGGRQVITASDGREVSLTIRERPAPALPPIVEEALAKARNFVRPDSVDPDDEYGVDEVLTDALEQARCVREIATGMFYKVVFPPLNSQRRPDPRGTPQKKADVERWLTRRRDYNSAVRQQMVRGVHRLDSPALCEAAARRALGLEPALDASGLPLPTWECPEYLPWLEVRDLVVPDSQAVRLHPFLVDDAAAWAAEGPRGIVWYSMVEFAEWARERHGVPVFEGGKKNAAALMREDGRRSVFASLKSHGRGRDRLQFSFHRGLVINTMANSRGYGQLLARQHRRRQQHDVVMDVYAHTPELMGSLQQALRRSSFVETMTLEQTKLLHSWTGEVHGLDDEEF